MSWPHEFIDMEPEWFYDETTGERVNCNALAPLVCKHCGSLDIDCDAYEDCPGRQQS